MGIYGEQEPRKSTLILFITLIFLLAYPLWHIGERELFWNEGKYACIAADSMEFPPVMMPHGQFDASVYPLYPMLVKAVSQCSGFSMEFSLRAVSVLSLFLLTLIVCFACYRAGGVQAGAAGAVAMFTTILCGEKSIEGYPTMLTALILYGGWLLWFEFTLSKGNWNYAWLSAGIFGALAYYSAGPTGLFLFFAPLLVQQRPLNIWTKLRYSGLYAALFIIVVTLLLYYAPQWNLQKPAPAVESFSFSGWLKHLATYPFMLIVRFLPWSLLLWAPFCAALIPLGRNPLFEKYNRVLFSVTAVILWLKPGASREMLYLLPLIATMAGIDYWIVVRRYGWKILKVMRIYGWTLLVLSAVACGFLFCPESLLLYLQPLFNAVAYREILQPVYLLLGQIVAAAVLISIGLYFTRYYIRIWLVTALFFCGTMLLFWSTVYPVRTASHEKRDFGNQIRRILDNEADFKKLQKKVLYKDSAISGLYGECYYMSIPVKSVDIKMNFQQNEEFVYVLSTGVPSSSERGWSRLYDMEYKDKHLYLYKGQLRKDEYDDYGDD
ncbi:MAG: hypothetical protein IKB16_02775 [Lentisphaeria bacterium]|nr:hypothetical protein [Lentisphaeria bacterium]